VRRVANCYNPFTFYFYFTTTNTFSDPTGGSTGPGAKSGVHDCLVAGAGYGYIYPVTTLGRVITMLYALVGIPLCLVVLAAVGKSLTRAIKFLWSFIRRFYYTGSFRRVRQVGSVVGRTLATLRF